MYVSFAIYITFLICRYAITNVMIVIKIFCGDHFCARPRVAVVTKAQDPTSKKNPPTYCLISCEVKGVVYHYKRNYIVI